MSIAIPDILNHFAFMHSAQREALPSDSLYSFLEALADCDNTSEDPDSELPFFLLLSDYNVDYDSQGYTIISTRHTVPGFGVVDTDWVNKELIIVTRPNPSQGPQAMLTSKSVPGDFPSYIDYLVSCACVGTGYSNGVDE